MLIDTHTHLYYDSMKERIENVISQAKNNRVLQMICIGTDLKSSEECIKIAENYDNIYATVGVHPHDSNDVPLNYLQELSQLAKSSKKVVAIGEIGIDHFRNLSPKKIQNKVMIDQMKLAYDLRLPIVFHNRDADSEIYEILKNNSFHKALAHCFSSNLTFAKKLIDLEILISFSGNITFKNATNHDSLMSLTLDQFVLETDCPFLAPHPFRGEKNEPKYLKVIAEKAAELHGVTLDEIEKHTTRNAKIFFNLP
jgi:TatD DNase family protein